MAIKYQDIKKDLEKQEFTQEELRYIDQLEVFIDDKIKTLFDNNNIRIKMTLVDFYYSPNATSINIKETRKKLMRKELEKRYKEAGWDIKEELNDGYHSGEDYWVLTGKK